MREGRCKLVVSGIYTSLSGFPVQSCIRHIKFAPKTRQNLSSTLAIVSTMIKASILSALFAILAGLCLSVAARSHIGNDSDVISKDSSVETEGTSNSTNERIFALKLTYGTCVGRRPYTIRCGQDHISQRSGTSPSKDRERSARASCPFALHQVDSVAQVIPSIRRGAAYAAMILKTRRGAANR